MLSVIQIQLPILGVRMEIFGMLHQLLTDIHHALSV